MPLRVRNACRQFTFDAAKSGPAPMMESGAAASNRSPRRAFTCPVTPERPCPSAPKTASWTEYPSGVTPRLYPTKTRFCRKRGLARAGVGFFRRADNRLVLGARAPQYAPVVA